MQLVANGQRQEGLVELQKAVNLEPNNAQYRIDYRNQLLQDLAAAVARAQLAQGAGDIAGARAGYADALKIDPTNEAVRRALAMLDMEQRMRAIVAEAEKLADAGHVEAARDMLRSALADNPASAAIARALVQMQARIDKADEARQAKLAASSVMKRPVTLQFRDANLRMVFEALSRTTGLNVIMDRDVRADLKTTIFVRDASVDDTVNLILLQNQLEKKVLNANTLFIYPATANKQKEYQDLKVRTFQLSNADGKHVQNVLKSVLKIKDMALDERTNTLVIRDTPAAIAVAEKLVLATDLADAEVMMEVQLLEITRDRLTNLGVQWPNKVIISTPPDRLTLSDLEESVGRRSENHAAGGGDQPAAGGLRHQPAREPAHPRTRSGKGADSHWRQGAGDYEHGDAGGFRLIGRHGSGAVSRCRHQARGRTAGLSGGRHRHQAEPRGQQHRQADRRRQRQQHAGLSDRHAQRVDDAAAARR